MGLTRIVTAGGGKTALVGAPGKTSVVSGGVAGPAGADAQAFEHTQASPSAEWIVNHNLGIEPIVAVLTTGGAEIDANVVHVSINQVRIYFAAAQAGRARCI